MPTRSEGETPAREGCPGREALAKLFSDALDADARAAFEEHIDRCEACRREVAALVRDVTGDPSPSASDDTLLAATEASRSRGAGQRRLEAGERLGRYIVLRVLGAGAMGVVHAAYDPELDRTVALKILRAHPGAEGLDGLRARLRREARTLARLSHPNVVGVYEVDRADDLDFVAMEYVEGGNLRSWLAERRPGWRSVLERLLEAGRGLAAAHRAGIVHRDVKPGNILVGIDGRARMSDFGLARGAADGDGSTGEFVGELDELTRSGELPGTPRYMAPEQFEGAVADARSDLFALCVTLYEGLYATRPFDGDSLPVLCASVLEGKLRAPPRGTGVPRAIEAVLRRGLAVNPDDRFANVDALLDALTRAASLRRRRVLSAGAAAALVTAGLVGASLTGAAPIDPCPPPLSRVDAVWGPSRRDALHHVFLASGASFAESSFERTAARLDRAVAEWIGAHHEACAATWIHGEQSAPHLDLRMRCLDRRLRELDGLVDALTLEPDAGLVERSIDAVAALTPTAVCADFDAITAITPLPEDPRVRARVDALDVTLARDRARLELGSSHGLARRAAGHVEEARALDYAPLLAQALRHRANVADDAGHHDTAEADARASVEAAARGRDDVGVAAAMIDLLMIVGNSGGRVDEAMATMTAAQAAVLRAGEPPFLTIALHNSAGVLEVERGAHDRAIAELEVALELAHENLGDAHPRLAGLENNLGRAHLGAGHMEAAETAFDRGLAVAREVYGTDHPTVADILNNIALVRGSAGDLEGELRGFAAAAAMYERTLGDHTKTAGALSNVGTSALQLGRDDEARAALGRALEILTRVVGPDHPWVATVTFNLAVLDLRGGTYAQGITRVERALAIRRAANREDPRLITYTDSLGDLYGAVGEHERAAVLYREALAAAEAKLGPEHTRVAALSVELGRLHNLEGEHRSALAACARARAIYEARGPEIDAELVGALNCAASAHLGRGAPTEALALLERAADLDANAFGNQRARARTLELTATTLDTLGREASRAAELRAESRALFERYGHAYERERTPRSVK